MLATAAFASQATAVRPVDIPKGEGLPITVFAGEGPTLKPLDRFGAIAWLSWDEEGLKAKVRVTDTTPMTSDDLNRLYTGDSVELVLKVGESMAQIVAAPGGLINNTGPRIKLFDYRTPEARAKTPIIGDAEGFRTANGYELTLTLPWSSLGIKPETGLVVGARVAVNDSVPGGPRTLLRWLGNQSEYDFMNPAPVRLASTASSEPAIRAWAATTEQLDKVHVNVMADKSMAGQTAEVKEGDKVWATGKLEAEGGVAVARMAFDLPEKLGGLSLVVDGKSNHALTLPDLAAERRRLFMVTERSGTGWNVPVFDRRIFYGKKLPTIDYKDRKPIERLVGPVTIQTDFYDASGTPVTTAERPGRYGAVVKVSAKDLSYTLYQTLFRTDGSIPDPEPWMAAARFEGKRANPLKADRDYWHTLRKSLGSAVRYEWFAKTPDSYDPAKSYPLIVYLHGSGGGDAASWDAVKVSDGPMGPAHQEKDFPFVVVALRSPGGWSPPAVEDAIDEVLAKYRIDEDRVYLTGFSMGGMGTWQVAYDRPDRFAAIAPVGARSGDANLMPLLAKVPAWVFNGAEDNVCTPEDAREAVANLRKAGSEVKYTEIPNADHVGSLRYTYALKELYEWFLRHRR